MSEYVHGGALSSRCAVGDGGVTAGQIDTGLTQGEGSTGPGVMHDGQSPAGTLTGIAWLLLDGVLALL